MVKIIKGGITKIADIQAIVNAASLSLLGGDDVGGAIHRATGRELLFECRLLGGCKTRQVKITEEYNLHYDHVIHTMGPVRNSGGKNGAEFLGQCYYSSMKVVPENGIQRIASPSISTGICCFPVGQAAKIAARAVNDLLGENGQTSELMEWVLFDDYTKQVYDEAVEESHRGI